MFADTKRIHNFGENTLQAMNHNTILLIIDPQNDFCDSKGALYVPNAEKDIQNIIDLLGKHGDKIDVLGVAVWDNPDDTRKAIEELNITWPVIIGVGKLTEPTDLYGIKSIPHIIIFGPDGTIFSRGLTGDELALRLNSYLKF